ncbi:MAG: pentapeptide repeat-containing protein [Cyanobacteria bacterium P01_B01_bin.77]
MIDRPYILQPGLHHCLLADPPDLPLDLSFSQPSGEIIRVILLGSPGGIHQTRHLLHNLNYVEVNQWSPLIEIPEGNLLIRPDQGEQMSIVVRRFACRSFWLNQWLKGRWRGSISWYESTTVEHGLETLTEDLKNLAIFDLMSLLANLAIIISLGSFLTGGEQQRHDQQVYEAWQTITAAHAQPGNGGRKRALEFLNSSPGTPGRRRWFGWPWQKEDLRGVDVSKANLPEVQLPAADLASANFQRANLEEANFQRANLEEANFQKANLEEASFQRANLGKANLEGAKLQESKLQEAILWGGNFQGANLKESNFQRVTLQWATLKGANLEGANLEGAILEDANLEGAILPGALLLAIDFRASENLTIQQLAQV